MALSYYSGKINTAVNRVHCFTSAFQVRHAKWNKYNGAIKGNVAPLRNSTWAISCLKHTNPSIFIPSSYPNSLLQSNCGSRAYYFQLTATTPSSPMGMATDSDPSAMAGTRTEPDSALDSRYFTGNGEYWNKRNSIRGFFCMVTTWLSKCKPHGKGAAFPLKEYNQNVSVSGVTCYRWSVLATLPQHK